LDLHRASLPALLDDDALSSHGLGLATQLELARRLGILPLELRFLGAPLRDARLGAPCEMAALVEAAVARIAALAMRAGEFEHA
jgi:hypothetical protein